MFTYNERDMHRMPSPLKTHLPIKPDIISSGIMEEDVAGRESEVRVGYLAVVNISFSFFLLK